MVSALSARLLADRGDSLSNSSSRGSRTSSHQKRTSSGLMKNTAASATGGVDKIESSVSGYSADREDPSVYPPVVSIDLHGRGENKSSRDALDCPKRRKIQEIAFAATSAKADLERADMEFKKMDKDIKESKRPGDIRIGLSGVTLMHSNDVSAPLITSNVSGRCSVREYEALLHAVSDSYSSSSGNMKSYESSQEGNDSSFSDRSTSSVSDTESDSGSDNINSGNNHILFIPPLVEDALDPIKAKKVKVIEKMNPCNVISCASNATTLAESLQLCPEARLVTASSAPYTIIHANAALLRLLGKEGTHAVLGESFFSLLDPNANANSAKINLTNCMVSSSMGNDSKLFLLPKTPGDDPVEASIRVSPIVARKTESKEVTNVTHFAIDFYDGSAQDSSIMADSFASRADDLPVGVMG